MTGTEVRACAGRLNTAACAIWESDGALSQMGKSVFVRGKHMSYRYAIPFVLCSFFLCAIALPARQALGRAPQTPESGDAATSARDKRRACILLTNSATEAAQGEPGTET